MKQNRTKSSVLLHTIQLPSSRDTVVPCAVTDVLVLPYISHNSARVHFNISICQTNSGAASPSCHSRATTSSPITTTHSDLYFHISCYFYSGSLAVFLTCRCRSVFSRHHQKTRVWEVRPRPFKLELINRVVWEAACVRNVPQVCT